VKDSLHELWNWFWSLDWYQRHLVLAGVVFVIAFTVLAWQIAIPLLLVAVVVGVYLWWSGGKGEL
jgi:hypothetical protein